MLYLIAAVVLVGLLGLANLLLLFGVIRRLRKMAAQPSPMMDDGPALGEKLPEFAATTTDGEPISAELLGGPALIGLFSPDCGPCRELLPTFIERAGRMSEQVLAVVVAGSDEEAATDVARLAKVARVVREQPMGAIQTALKVNGYPTVIATDATGVVVSSDAGLPAAVHA
jgi:thiol-disulfide isomerase/thioredoxin